MRALLFGYFILASQKKVHLNKKTRQKCGDEVWICTFDDVYNMGVLFLVLADFDNFYISNESRARKIQKAVDAGEVPKMT